ncbi:hypothetical protein ES705_48854 [subsurface metagenome]
MDLNKSIKYLEDLKENKNIDADTINKIQDKIKSLDEASLLEIKELVEKRCKPIRKVWVMAIKSKDKEELEQYEEMLNEIMNRGRTTFPEAMFTISLLKQKDTIGEKNKIRKKYTYTSPETRAKCLENLKNLKQYQIKTK